MDTNPHELTGSFSVLSAISVLKIFSRALEQKKSHAKPPRREASARNKTQHRGRGALRGGYSETSAISVLEKPLQSAEQLRFIATL